jgi:hypothetical protein
VIAYWASPTGAGDGLTFDTPGSIVTVRALARAHAAEDDVTVYLRGGTYRLASTLQFETADSGANGHTVTWCGYGVGHSVLSGGVLVTGWTLDDGPKNIWRASVPARQDARQIYVNGVRATRARTANARGLSSADGGDTYVSTDATLPTFARPEDLEFVFTRTLAPWIEDRISVASATRVGNTTTCTMEVPGGAGVRFPAAWTWATWPAAPTWVENAYELLSASTPGQWYLNHATDTLYYVPRPGEDMATAEVVLPVLEQVLATSAASPVSNVTFRGVSIEHAGWLGPTTMRCFLETQANDHRVPPAAWDTGTDLAPPHNTMPPSAVSIGGASGVTLDGCLIRRHGAHGIYVGAGSRSCTVRRSTLTDISGTALRVGDLDAWAPASPTSGILVEQNLVRDVALEYRGGVGIFAGIVEHVRILHNEIRDLPYTGISFGWGWDFAGYDTNASHANEIGWNLVHDVCKVMSDGGGIYTLGRNGLSGGRSSVHDNYLYAVGLGDVAITPLYADAGSGYFDFTDNVCVKSGAQSRWYHANGAVTSISGTGNFATAGLVIWSTGGAEVAGIDLATPVTGTDPAGWPAGAQAIVLAAGIDPPGGAPPSADFGLIAPPPVASLPWWSIGAESDGYGMKKGDGGAMTGLLQFKIWDAALGRWRVVPFKRFR